ncbi:hypothetical protein KIN20_027411 [Parelaphostrongylus tenuis]|uniref:Uncharacterized protein n=1 Tax=Parelaphostrongylus tenuis TaxID=148309 RepID=A0AAD5QZA7_PARTN|nr:hypothetical protein KIN20_027411 [Parelaphostrongylus tenuis]
MVVLEKKMYTLTNMARHATYHFMISLLAMILTVFGCGVIPTGQDNAWKVTLALLEFSDLHTRTRTFKVSGFTLPVAMVCSAAPEVRPRVPGIAADMSEAQAFVSRPVIHIVIDVHESHARSALLLDAVISVILDRLTVNITYTSVKCPKVHLGPTDKNKLGNGKMETSCIIINNTVTSIYTMTNRNDECMADKTRNCSGLVYFYWYFSVICSLLRP